MSFTGTKDAHGGWNGILHGGVTFSLMDEAFGWCLFFKNIPAVTAKIETHFHKPIQIGEVRVDGELVAESEAVLCAVTSAAG